MRPSDLPAARWKLIDRILEQALEVPESERASYLERACGDDHDLRRQVARLLSAHARAEGPLEEHVGALGAALLASSYADPDIRGKEIGPFRIVREVGRGGMGAVYLAEDTRLGRPVALKALPPYLGTGPAARDRFVREARAVSALDHPNVATLHDIDATDDGQLYMVFSYYEGTTLAERISEGPLVPATAFSIVQDVARGLAAAHERGIIHRDVKPSNILLTASGGVKLLDFGVAKVVGEDFTGDGGPLGTVAYMSPEQARGDTVDHRTDLWSLGVTLYEMLTGRRPFAGDDPASLLRSIVEDRPVTPRRLLPDLSDSAERIVASLLTKDPQHRYASAQDLLDDISALDAGRHVAGHKAKRKGRGPWAPVHRWRSPDGLAALRRTAYGVVLLVVAAGLVQLNGRRNSPLPRTERLAVLPLANLTGDAEQHHVVSGIHEALTTELGEMGSFDVIARTSVAHMLRGDPSIAEIADSLRADAVVQGSVLVSDDSVVVSIQLSDVGSEKPTWSGVYRADVGGTFDLTSRIARAISATVERPPSSSAEARLASAAPVNAQAYDAYLRGRFNLSRNNAEGFALGERYFREALRIDSTFAPAYVDLAEIQGRAAFFGLRDPSETLGEVGRLIDRALAIDSTLALAFVRRAAVRMFWDRDLVGAERDARRALALNPSLSDAYYTLSEVLAIRGDLDGALRLAERGSELSPWSEFASVRPALVHYYSGDFAEAIDRVQEAIEFFPEFWQAHWILCVSLAGAGRPEEGSRPCEEAVALSHGASMALGGLGWVETLNGDEDAARAILARLEEPPEGAYVAPTNVAMVHAGLGDKDQAFAWLDRAYEERDLTLVHLQEQAFFAPLRSDPRFLELVERIGLDYRSASADSGHPD